MNESQYIEHEVQIRVLKETTESKFVLMQKNFEDKFSAMEKNSDDRFDLIMKNFNDKLENRFKSLWSIAILIMGLLMPVFLKSIGII